MVHLIVVEPFADYVPGDRITDPDAIGKLENNGSVVRVSVPDAAPNAPSDPAPHDSEV